MSRDLNSWNGRYHYRSQWVWGTKVTAIIPSVPGPLPSFMAGSIASFGNGVYPHFGPEGSGLRKFRGHRSTTGGYKVPRENRGYTPSYEVFRP